MKLSTIRLIIVAAVVAALGIWALAGCSSSSSTTSLPPSSQGILGGHTTAPPSSAVTGTCRVGFFNSSMTFVAGPSGSTQTPNGFDVTLRNGTSQPVQVSWVTVTVSFHGRPVGSQTLQNDTADTINPGGSDSTWSAQWVPNEGEGHVPLRIMNATNGNIENHPGFTCQLYQWGNAT